MPAGTRITDGTTGICDIGLDCCPHGRAGTNATGSPNVTINHIPAHLLADTGSCNCPHGGSYESIEGSPNVTINSRKVTRIGDATRCLACGKMGAHVEGSPNVAFNGG
jgi:uncharacterized Zn-binding protein involved in type VI secretion